MAVIRVIFAVKSLLLSEVAAGMGLSGIVRTLFGGVPVGVGWVELLLPAFGGHLMMVTLAVIARRRLDDAKRKKPGGRDPRDLRICDVGSA